VEGDFSAHLLGLLTDLFFCFVFPSITYFLSMLLYASFTIHFIDVFKLLFTSFSLALDSKSFYDCQGDLESV